LIPSPGETYQRQFPYGINPFMDGYVKPLAISRDRLAGPDDACCDGPRMWPLRRHSSIVTNVLIAALIART